MKNVIFQLAGACLCLVASATYAQRTDHSRYASVKDLSPATEIASARRVSGYANSISSKALRDFNRSYKDAVDPQWSVLKDGYSASCLLHNHQARVLYDRRGCWVGTIEYQQEADLPSDVRGIVKSTYYDYSISQVEKISYGKMQPLYCVHIEDAHTFKIIKVRDGEMEVAEDYVKSR